MRMKVVVVTAAAVVVVAASTWAYANRRDRMEWDARYRAGRLALSHALDHKDDGVLLFDPRDRDLEHALDDLHETRMPFYGQRDRDRRYTMITGLERCERMMNSYRDANRMADEAVHESIGTVRGLELLKAADDIRLKTLMPLFGCDAHGDPDNLAPTVDPA